MKKFALFPALLGTDQLVPLDGRWSTFTCQLKVEEQAERLNKHWYKHNPITKAQICVGRIANPTIIKEWSF